MSDVRNAKWALVAAAIFGSVGCQTGPSAVLAPYIDADDAAERAIEIYDRDGDGYITGTELDAAASLKAAMSTLDSDQDGKVSEAEVADRIRSWKDSRVGITTIRCRAVSYTHLTLPTTPYV